MKRSISAIILLASLLLVSCSQTNDGTSAGDDTSNGDAGTTAVAVDSEYKKPDSNYNGTDFTIASYDYDESDPTNWMASLYCEAYAEEQNGDVLNDAIYDRNRIVEEELGVSIKIFPMETLGSGYGYLSKYILSGDNVCDIALINGTGLKSMFGVSGEYLTDIRELGGLDLTHSWWDQKSVEEFDIFGSLYAVNGDISLWSKYSPIVYFFNKQVVDDHGIENLYDMVRAGKWTLDELIELCTIVSKDIDGDGIMSDKDAYGMSHQRGLLTDMVLACGIRITEKDSEGISRLTLNNERTIEAVEKIVPLLNNDQITVSSEKFTNYNNIFLDLHVGMFKDNRLLFNQNQLLITMNMRDMETDFGIVPSPKLNEAQDDYVTVHSPWWSTYLIVPITNMELNMTGEVCEAMGYYAQQLITPAFIDVTVLNKTLRDTESEEMLNLVFDSISYDLAAYFNWGSISDEFKSLAYNNSTNFASFWASTEQKVQTAIDATFDAWVEVE